MAARQIESRVASLETDMALIKEQLRISTKSQIDWVDAIFGSFDDDPIYEEATRLGRKYRESLRP